MSFESKTIKNISTKITVELLYYLVRGTPDLTTATAIRVLYSYDEKIMNAAIQMYNDYKIKGEIENLDAIIWEAEKAKNKYDEENPDDAAIGIFDNYIRHLWDDLDVHTNVEMYSEILLDAEEMYTEYANTYNFPKSTKEEYMDKVRQAIVKHKSQGNFTGGHSLLTSFKSMLDKLKTAKSII